MPSVMHATSAMPASAASRIASAAPGGGTKITDALAPVARTASSHRVEDRDAVDRLCRPCPARRRRPPACRTRSRACAWNWPMRAHALDEEPRVLVAEDRHQAARPSPRRRPSRRLRRSVSAGVMFEPGLREDRAALRRVRALEPHDERHLDAELARRRDHALRDQVAAHDAAEDVDEDRLHVRVAQDQLERLLDLLLVAPPPTSRKFAGLPPQTWIMSIVAIARPAPFTMQPMLPSRPT